MKHCIVTPQFVGLDKNGGIGTHAFYFAKLLKHQLNHDVSLLYTGAKQGAASRQDIRHLPAWLRVIYSDDLPLAPQIHPVVSLNYLRSLRCFEWLRTQTFDAIHFQDWQGAGFTSIQAKRTASAFQDTLLTCMLNGPSKWTRETVGEDVFQNPAEVVIDHMESYCIKNCDHLLSPSHYAIDWARQSWGLMRSDGRVLPYLYQAPATMLTPRRSPVNTLVFYGRLEKRKGLFLFLDTLSHLKARTDMRPSVVFVGNPVPHPAGDTKIFLEQEFLRRKLDFPCTIHSALGHLEAQELIASFPSALVVVPSYAETLGFTVIESIEMGFDLIASNSTGIKELLEDNGRLFELNPNDFCEKILAGLKGELPPVSPKYSSRQALDQWLEYAMSYPQNQSRMTKETPPPRADDLPPVSVCIPYYNAGASIQETLQALKRQSYANFEVILCEDQSSDQSSQEVFKSLATSPAGNWKFLSNESNLGAGATRNRLARHATFDLLLFVDADNVPQPDMIARLVRAMQHCGADSVGCHHNAFHNDLPLLERGCAHRFAPLGGPLLASLLGLPCMGETNTLIKKAVFESVGGFSEDRNYGNEDWEFLNRVCLQGYYHEIVPETLYDYRITKSGNLASTPTIQNRIRSMRPFFENRKNGDALLASALFINELRFYPENPFANAQQQINDQASHLFPSRPPEVPSHSFERSYAYKFWSFLRHPRKYFRRLLPRRLSETTRTHSGVFARLLEVYQNQGVQISTALNPIHYDGHPQAAFTHFFINGESATNALGISLEEVYFLECLSAALRPRSIFIIGNSFGWSTLALALINPQARVVAMDSFRDVNTREGFSLTLELVRKHRLNATVLEGTSPQDVRACLHQGGFKSADLVFIDACHENDAVFADCIATLPFLSDHGVCLLHDVIEFGLQSGANRSATFSGLSCQILHRTTSGMAALSSKNTRQSVKQVLAAFSHDESTEDSVRDFLEQQGAGRRGF